jgi:glutamate/tyrosine decarboxylase-like PLP-dependent enzyme
VTKAFSNALCTGTLDPSDWPSLRSQGHRMLDDMFDYLQHIRARPVWQPIPDNVRAQFQSGLPRRPEALENVYEEFTKFVLPYATGNVHPGFMGWVHGGGTAVGMLSEMLAAGLNANCGGRDHVPIEVERQIVRWMRELYDFPEEASGLLVTGTSMANLIAVLVARTAAIGPDVRVHGLAAGGTNLRAYASAAAHGCIAQAMDLSGLGTAALRRIPTNIHGQMDLSCLENAIRADRSAGLTPFLLIATAGTVDTGAIDDLQAIATVCQHEKLHFHVDGAYGALAKLSPKLEHLVSGIERADSIAFDFHKWAQVPYDAGFILVRDGKRHHETFARPVAYLSRETRGLAAGSPWPCDFGPELSRGFRALKIWFTLKTFGSDQLGAVIARTCGLARYLETLVLAQPDLELLAPVQLNVVCFRYRAPAADAVNANIVADIHEAGIAAPSTTLINGQLSIRAAFVNHRTQPCDVEALVAAVLHYGRINAGASDQCSDVNPTPNQCHDAFAPLAGVAGEAPVTQHLENA